MNRERNDTSSDGKSGKREHVKQAKQQHTIYKTTPKIQLHRPTVQPPKPSLSYTRKRIFFIKLVNLLQETAQ